MHGKNHAFKGQLLFSFNYLPHVGEAWGENIESGWAEQSRLAGSAKEQNDGNRHDKLDNFNGYWN
jgi:hypothetical protein